MARSGRSALLLLLTLIVLTAGCSRKYVQEGYEGGPTFIDVSPQAATELIRTKKALVIVDVRTGGEYKSGHIPGAFHLSYFDILFGSTEGLPQGAPLLLICASGHRSYWAGGRLRKKGYSEIYDLRGGMNVWSAEGYPIVTSD